MWERKGSPSGRAGDLREPLEGLFSRRPKVDAKTWRKPWKEAPRILSLVNTSHPGAIDTHFPFLFFFLFLLPCGKLVKVFLEKTVFIFIQSSAREWPFPV